MHSRQTIARAQQLALLAMSAGLTMLLLAALGAQADTRHAAAQAAAHSSAALSCAVPQRAARS